MYKLAGRAGLALAIAGELRGLDSSDADYPGSLDDLVREEGALERAAATLRRLGRPPEADFAWLPPFANPSKILCVGLNYADHTKESPYEQPAYPTIFARFASSLIAHRAPLVRPLASVKLDYEGELAVIIGRAGRHISRARALEHVLGYAAFNDGSVRDFQMKTPQWTVGKNFDATGPFGPELVTADELPAGAAGLRLETRLNGIVMQSASTADMLFSVVDLIVTLSEAMTLEAGDVIVSGTPSGVGNARKPPLYMKHGDLCEIAIEGVGLLSNRVVDELERAA